MILVLLFTAGAVQAGEISFNRDIRPILSDRCFKCHGPDAKNQKSEFRLDSEQHSRADLGGYFGIVPGDLRKSEVHARIHHSDPDEVMPPRNSNLSLTERERKLLDDWILQGASFDRHWSFQPVPATVPVPASTSGWARNEIDRFVEAGFESHQVKPAPESPRNKWLRRVTFDLTGLPPTLAALAAFEADTRPDAYEKVTDALLKSTAYAERMASEWLDVARYSDSYGYQRDRERFVWPWRDWVIDSFTKNRPYDEFITLQLAGDLLPQPNQETIVPTAFNRLHGHEMEGGIVLEEYRVEYVADRAQTFSSAFLGLTMECARCHDHKYDPIPAKDFYALGSFFANIEESGLISYFTEAAPTPAMTVSNPQADAGMAASRTKIKAAEKDLQTLRDSAAVRDAFAAWLKQRPAATEISGLVASLSFDVRESNRLANACLPDAPAKTPAANIQVPGVSGQAIQFTGDDALEIPKVGRFDREHPFSAAMWVRPEKIVARANLFTRGGGADDAGSIGYELLLLDGKPTASLVHFWPGDAIRVQAVTPLVPEKWQHLSMSYDGSSRASGLKLYLNGQPLAVTIISDHLTRQNTKWTEGREDIVLGQRYRDRGFVNGQMDEFRLIDRRITDVEARQLFDGRSLTRLLAKDETQLTANDRAELFDYFVATACPPVHEARQTLQAARAELNRQIDALPEMTIMRELPQPKPAFVLTRGAYDRHGDPVTADTPSALPPFPANQPRNRLGLARWLTAPDHPLTARVTVNRYWQRMFGKGLVRTPEDFGSQGAPPTHPELLDWLARDFINHDWDLHHLLRQMALSATYRQSTVTPRANHTVDPENLTLCRSHPERLTGEMIRDNALAVSGLLVEKVGGPPVIPYEIEMSFDPKKPDEDEGLYRRSLYTLWKRNAAAPILVTFDAPKRDVCSLKRDATTSPLQALVTLNAPQFMEASRVLAARLLKAHGRDHAALIREAFLLLTSRAPDAQEAAIVDHLLQTQFTEFGKHPDRAAKLLTTGKAPAAEGVPAVEQAAVTVMVNALMNFDESLNQR